MNDPIIVSRGENNIIIVIPTLKTEKDIKYAINSIFIKNNIPYKVIDRSELPEALHYMSDAFNLKEGFENSNKISDQFEINFEKAKEIQREKWRKARENVLKELDVIYMRALESNDNQKQLEIVERKRKLRDITKIELPNDILAIHKTWPEDILGPRPEYL